MKIKIGNFEAEITRMSNDILMREESEYLNFTLANESTNVSDITNKLNSNFTGTLSYVDNDGVEEVFEGYICESIRKQYDEHGKTFSISFKKDILPSEKM